MIKQIIQYPTPLSVEFSTDVRQFDETLFSLIEDLKDTMNENNLQGLTAFQIGSYYNVAVVKDENGEILELINPRLINHKGRVTTEEKTAYFPGRSANIERYEEISIVYQKRDGKDASLRASGALAVVIQRKIDYTFGATFLHKMGKDQKDLFERGVDIGLSDYCPTSFNRDKILKVINFLLIVMLFNFIASFVVDASETLATMWEYQLYGSYGALLLNVIYFFYAQYEGKRYNSCSSCQIGNIIGTTLVSLVKLALLMGLSYSSM